jgi:hypothetical protein
MNENYLTLSDIMYSIELILDDHDDLPADLQAVLRCWPFLSPETRRQIVRDAQANVRTDVQQLEPFTL